MCMHACVRGGEEEGGRGGGGGEGGRRERREGEGEGGRHCNQETWRSDGVCAPRLSPFGNTALQN